MMQPSTVKSKPYQGCRRLIKNGTLKVIDWRRGERCLLQTNTRCGRPTKETYLHKKSYQTRQRERLVKKTMEIFEKDIKKAVYNMVAKIVDKSLVFLDCKAASMKDGPSKMLLFYCKRVSYDYCRKEF